MTDPATTAVADRLRAGLLAPDGRVRATWRVALAWPVLWVFTGGVLAGNLQAALPFGPRSPGPLRGLVQSGLHAGCLLIVLAGWARLLDRKPLSAYGVAATPAWFRSAAAGFVAVVVGFLAWYGLGDVLGSTTLTPVLSAPEGSLAAGLVVPAVALLLHAATQQVVFFRVVLGDALEGLRARGVAPAMAVVVALAVAVIVFIGMHGPATPLRLLDLAVAGAVFGLLYLHTDELALGVGAHFAALFSGVLFAPPSQPGVTVFEVATVLPGVLGTLHRYGFPKLLVAYFVLLAWLRWRTGGVGFEARSDR